MLWIELKAKIIQLIEEKELADKNIRLNALKSLEHLIKSNFPDIYRNPDSLLQKDKNEFKKELAKHKKLNGAESSVVNNFYQILQSQTNVSGT